MDPHRLITLPEPHPLLAELPVDDVRIERRVAGRLVRFSARRI